MIIVTNQMNKQNKSNHYPHNTMHGHTAGTTAGTTHGHTSGTTPYIDGRKIVLALNTFMFSKQMYTKFIENNNHINSIKNTINSKNSKIFQTLKKSRNSEKSENPEKNEKIKKSETLKKSMKNEKNENSEKNEKHEKSMKNEKSENSMENENEEKNKNSETLKKSMKNEKSENSMKNEKIIKNVNSVKNKNEVFSQLFWAFYTLVYGDYDCKKEFQIKQNFCVKLVEKVKSSRAILKEHRVKYVDFEKNLVFDKDIDLGTLKVLCALFKLNIIFVDNIKYYKFLYNLGDNFDEHDIFCIEKRGNKFDLRKIESEIDLEQIENSHYLIENIKKPINSVSYYKVIELKDIIKKLNLKDSHMNGKNKTKQELYQEICGCLIQN